MKSYHSKQSVKEFYLARIKGHQEAGNLIQGYGYWKEGKGSAVGCTVEAAGNCYGPNDRYPSELGLPEWLGHLEDHLFQALPVEEALKFPYEVLDAIPVGVPESAFSTLRDRFLMFWLERQKSQIDLEQYEHVGRAIDGVTALLAEAVAGAAPDSGAWYAAFTAARAAFTSSNRASTGMILPWAERWSAAETAAVSASEAAQIAALAAVYATSFFAFPATAHCSISEAARGSAVHSAAIITAEFAVRAASGELDLQSADLLAARKSAWAVREREAVVKREWLLAELRLLQTTP